MIRNLFLCLEYDGTSYQGWQRQAHSQTVQGEVERVLREILGQPVALRSAGRTDAGVHALGQAALCRVETALPPTAILHTANRQLPDDIVIVRMEDAPPEFDVRRHAIRRHYRYRLLQRSIRPAFERHTWAHIPYRFDEALLQEAVQCFEGTHEFAAFRSSACRAPRTRLTMETSRVSIEGDRVIFDFVCRSFLHHMVRVLVGTALDVAREKIALDDVKRLLRGEGGRQEAGRTAPPEGLILVGIEYAAPYQHFSTID
ncbi:MAG: tRNA pseudouridine(38-40) synthase TruA [Candidatus Sumerlaeia bacterium]|nr:tRNA pseudouridine(38-40) synthase TruA [Candidatus Sumerlaeia bacterium]